MPDILIIKPSSLGDIIHGLQVAATIKAQLPETRISWVVREIFSPLVQNSTLIDQVYIFKRQGGLSGFRALISEIRKVRYDYVLDMQGLLRSGLMTWRSRAQEKIGRADTREGASLFYDKKVALPPTGKQSHAVEILLQFAPALGLKAELATAPLEFKTPTQTTEDTIPAPSIGTKTILMFPESRRPEKCWLGFEELTQIILRETKNYRIVWAGNNKLETKVPENDRFVNFTGKGSLAGLSKLISEANCVISNDSGPMHLAAAMHVKTLGIFGPTDPKLYGPYPPTHPRNNVIVAPSGNLSLLKAEEVYAHLRPLL